MKALPGPTPTPRSSGGSGRAGVGSDLVVPLALFPGLPFVAALGLIYIEGGWTGVLLTLGALIAIVLVFAVHATEDSRRYKRTARFWARQAVYTDVSSTVADATPREEITQPWISHEEWDAATVRTINENGEVVELRVMWETPLNEHTAEGERR